MVKFRLTGASLGSVGVQWEQKDDDREIARRVLNLLADRRLLWKDFTVEVEVHCVGSAIQIRRELGRHLDNPEISAPLAARVRLLQTLFRSFIDELGPYGGDQTLHRWSSVGTDPMSMALGRLRALVGVQIGALASEFELEVGEDLALIIPDEAGWFFERFPPGAHELDSEH